MIRTSPCLQARTRVQPRAAHATEAHVPLRVRLCWNAQGAFARSGLDHDAEHPLVIPATVTAIPDVSERALTSSSVRRYACGVHPCLPVPSGRPALPLPQT